MFSACVFRSGMRCVYIKEVCSPKVHGLVRALGEVTSETVELKQMFCFRFKAVSPKMHLVILPCFRRLFATVKSAE